MRFRGTLLLFFTSATAKEKKRKRRENAPSLPLSPRPSPCRPNSPILVQRSIGAVFFLSISSASGAISRAAKSLSIARKSSRSLCCCCDDEDSDDDDAALSALAPVESIARLRWRSFSALTKAPAGAAAAARLVWARRARRSMVSSRERGTEGREMR